MSLWASVSSSFLFVGVVAGPQSVLLLADVSVKAD